MQLKKKTRQITLALIFMAGMFFTISCSKLTETSNSTCYDDLKEIAESMSYSQSSQSDTGSVETNSNSKMVLMSGIRPLSLDISSEEIVTENYPASEGWLAWERTYDTTDPREPIKIRTANRRLDKYKNPVTSSYSNDYKYFENYIEYEYSEGVVSKVHSIATRFLLVHKDTKNIFTEEEQQSLLNQEIGTTGNVCYGIFTESTQVIENYDGTVFIRFPEWNSEVFTESTYEITSSGFDVDSENEYTYGTISSSVDVENYNGQWEVIFTMDSNSEFVVIKNECLISSKETNELVGKIIFKDSVKDYEIVLF